MFDIGYTILKSHLQSWHTRYLLFLGIFHWPVLPIVGGRVGVLLSVRHGTYDIYFYFVHTSVVIFYFPHHCANANFICVISNSAESIYFPYISILYKVFSGVWSCSWCIWVSTRMVKESESTIITIHKSLFLESWDFTIITMCSSHVIIWSPIIPILVCVLFNIWCAISFVIILAWTLVSCTSKDVFKSHLKFHYGINDWFDQWGGNYFVPYIL